jgi:DNA replication protein DnaC
VPESYHEELIAFCKRLKIASAMADRAETTDGETHIEFLYNLLRREIELRDQAHIENIIKDARFPVHYTFDQFRTDEVEFPEDCTIEDLQSLQFLRDHKNLIMYGGTGTGKTMLSICIGMQACRQGIPVKFFRTAGFINKLNSQKKRGTYEKFIKQLDDTPILILDEFGYVPYDRIGSELMFDYLSERHEKSGNVVILNTNLEFSQWVNVLYNAKMTTALVGRLTHHCQLLLFPGVNHRLKESSINEFYNAMVHNGETAGKA